MTDPEKGKKGRAIPVRRVSTRTVYQNSWMLLREDIIERADGSRGVYSVVDKPHFAVVIPFERDGFHMIEQYRYPIGRRSIEFPQGTAPGRQAAEPAEVARLELAQETGLRAGTLEQLGFLFNASGLSSQGFHAFLAVDLEPGPAAHEPEEQDLRTFWISRIDLEERIRAGAITDAATIAAHSLFTLQHPHARD